MEERTFNKSTMVSRLPKFGSRPPSLASPLPNGCDQPVPSRDEKGKMNGAARVAPSLKWKRGVGTPATLPTPKPVLEPRDKGEVSSRPQLIPQQPATPTVREIKKPSAPTSKLQRPTLFSAPRGSSPQNWLKGPSGAALRYGSGLRRPGAGTGATPSNLLESLSQSSDSLKLPPPTGMVRSQSCTHFRPVTNTSSLPVTRSFSFNKRLQPGGAQSRPPALGYRLTRPSLVRQPRRLTPGKGQGDPKMGATETPPVTPEPPSDPAKMAEEPRVAAARYLSEGLEDMSVSSSSSLEHNDTSEEYLDDFDNLGDGGSLLLLPVPQPDDNRQGGAPMSDQADWPGMDLAGREDLCGDRLLSPDVDFPHGSSLDLSPSDSSGGTYMWDEEGLEPLGVSSLPCGSYGSDINSGDILNDLDNLESCDLEDDDLMLDADLPEDDSLHSVSDVVSPDGTSRSEGRWRRRQHRWSGPSRAHHDNRFDGYPGMPQPASRDEVHNAALDELTLRHMAQECSSVKAQLLKLNILLQMEDEAAIQDALFMEGLGLELGLDITNALQLRPVSPEPSLDITNAPQVEALWREVQTLREELRSKEKTIAQLIAQQAAAEPSGCRCQQRVAETTRERQAHLDKATQMPWRSHADVLPVPASPQQGLCPGTPRARRKCAPGGHRQDWSKAEVSLISSHDMDAVGSGEERPATGAGCGGRPPQVLQPTALTLRQHLSQGRLTTPAEDPSEPSQTAGGPPSSPPSPHPAAPAAAAAASARPARALPSPHQRSLLERARSPGRPAVAVGRARLKPRSSAPPQASASSPGLPRAPCPGYRELESGLPRPSGLVPPNHSRLPKPKIH